jgi:putative glutamine amidotransferase
LLRRLSPHTIFALFIINRRGRMPVVVGIPMCSTISNEGLVHATAARYAEALTGGAGVVPILIPPVGKAQAALLDRIDGLLVPGSASNVHPSHYGVGDSLTPDLHDLARDATTLPLMRSAVARGVPILAICRGIQELNVALGGTLHQCVHTLPGRRDHRGGDGKSRDADFGPRHVVALTGALAGIVGASEIMVNSLHSQAIDRPAPGLVIEAMAEDGTIEAVFGAGTPGFVLGLQWHPEWRYLEQPASVAIFRAFGEACRTRQNHHNLGSIGDGRQTSGVLCM